MKKVLKLVVRWLLILFVLINIIAAFHAYKFTHFYDHTTSVVKGPELMTGWEKAKVVLFGVNYAKRPIYVTPEYPYQNFHIITNDHIGLNGWYLPQKTARGTVILFHGHGGNKSGVLTEANLFYNYGYNVCMVDFRAHGNSQGNVCTIGYKESADVKAAYDYVAAKGEKNIVLWGISLGAATITKAMAEYDEIHPEKVILEMPFGSLTDAVKGRMRMMNLPTQPLTTLLTFWGGAEHGFWHLIISQLNMSKAYRFLYCYNGVRMISE